MCVFYEYPDCLNRKEFERWMIERKQGALAVADVINSLTPATLDLLRVNNPSIGNGIIKRIKAPEQIDPKVFVRQGKLTFSQADDLINLNGGNFTENIPRVVGTIWDALRSGENDGHSALPIPNLRERARLQYGYSIGEIDAAIEKAKILSYVETQENFNHELKEVGDIVAFSENAETEQSILSSIRAMANSALSVNYDDDKGLDKTQNDAVRMALNNPASIITGGPGTGKTTICAKIGERLENVLGLAVAARAARNLSERTNIETMTIAAYLYRSMNKRPPICDTLIIDEASMVSSKDMAAILRYSAEAGTVRIVFVGDKDQLFPIGWGSPFADLIEADAVPITRLEKLYRTKKDGGIALLASHFRDRERLQTEYSNVLFVEADETEIAEDALGGYESYVRGGIKPKHIGLITPYKLERYPYSAVKLNKQIRKMLNRIGYLKGDIFLPVPGDLVIGTKNQRKARDGHDYLNGQRGVVIEARACALAIQFDGNEEPEFFDPSELGEDGLPAHVSYGYATTIHKSQGGEYAHVIALVPRNINYTFGRRGLYTAITRAKETLAIIGALDVIPDIIKQREERRYTVLKALLGLPIEGEALVATTDKPATSDKPARDRPNIRVSVATIRERLAALGREVGESQTSDDDLQTAMEANG